MIIEAKGEKLLLNDEADRHDARRSELFDCVETGLLKVPGVELIEVLNDLDAYGHVLEINGETFVLWCDPFMGVYLYAKDNPAVIARLSPIVQSIMTNGY